MIDQKIRMSLRKTGITEAKKAELDALTIQVLDAQNEVSQNQAIVTSLTERFNNFQTYLAMADAKRSQALSNKNTVDQLAQAALDLQNNSSIACDEMVLADQQTKDLASQITDVMNKLVYSAEMVNKLSSFIIRKKALNPLISDELISIVGTAGTDANNAVALTLVALQSVFTAQATGIESEQAIALEYLQARELFESITGLQASQVAKSGAIPVTSDDKSLYGLIHNAYQTALDNYNTAMDALNTTTRQLNNAQVALNKSQVKLKSVQSGLSAAQAAALAS